MRKRRRYPEPPAPTSKRSKILGRVAAWYRQGFVENQAAQGWVRAKGVTDETLWESFQVGYAVGNLSATVLPGSELEGELKALGVLDVKGREVSGWVRGVPLVWRREPTKWGRMPRAHGCFHFDGRGSVLGR